MKRLLSGFSLIVLIIVMMGMLFTPVVQAKEKFAVCWSHYTGWVPLAYAADSGILDKCAEREGIEIQVDLVNDYIESINLFTSGHYKACTITNMDTLTIPAVGGVDSEIIIVGDFSNGNDGVVTRKGSSMKDLRGQTIALVQFSVSHYMTARALEMNGMSERDVTLVNVSDADIGSIFLTKQADTVVTWNPILMNVRNAKGAKMVFDSSKIPGEIIDMVVVHTEAPESLKRALTCAWYETMQVMSGRNGTTPKKEAIAFMARTEGATPQEFHAQLSTTAMFYSPKDAVTFAKSDTLKKTMDYVRTFSFGQGLFTGAQSKDDIGIQFPDGTIMGNKNNVKMRFNTKYMQMAADGTL